jgi:hypothetical protein
MALPMPAPPVLAGAPLNPIELALSGLNTNTYFIGLMMLLLNLGGRHLALGLTPEQDKLFQHPYIRRALLFVVIFVATRNFFTALWLSIGIIFTLAYLTNETSPLYLFGEPRVTQPESVVPRGLTTDEQEIYKRLKDKVGKLEAEEKNVKKDEKEDIKQDDMFVISYKSAMDRIRSI